MLVFVPVLILFGAAIAVLILQFVPRGMGIAWFSSVLFAMGTWVLVFVIHNYLPLVFSGQYWINIGIQTLIPSFRIDIINWPFVLFVSGLTAGILFVSSARIGMDSTPKEWATILILGGLGILVVTAANIMTAVIAFAVLDLIEIVILINSGNQDDNKSFDVKPIFWRIVGLVLFIAAYGLQLSAVGESDNWISLLPGPAHLLLAACILRLGIFPLNFLSGISDRTSNGVDVIRRVIGSISVFAIIVQIPFHPFYITNRILLIFYLFISAILPMILLFKKDKPEEEINNWIVPIGSVVAATYLLGNSMAGISFSIASLTLLSVIFLKYPVIKFTKVLGFLTIFAFSGMPLSPNISGFSAFGQYQVFPGGFFIVPIAILSFFAINNFLNRSPFRNDNLEQWTLLLSPIGLIVLLITIWGQNFVQGNLNNLISYSMPAFLSIFITIAIFLNHKFSFIDNQSIFGKIKFWKPQISGKTAGLSKKSLLNFGDFIQSPVHILRELFEGEGGVLWTVLSLVLIITVIKLIGVLN